MTDPVVVPVDQLSEEALDGLIAEFILREGTDYGSYEYSLEQKKEQIYKQLKSRKIAVVFDAEAQSCSILRCEEILSCKQI